MAKIYSARWVLPICSAPISDGAVAVEGPLIVGVGAQAEIERQYPDAQVSDYRDSVILPGLINAHSHLELTAMRGFLEKEENNFFAWLRKLTVARLAMTSEDLFVSATLGVVEAARAGITCLADSSSFAQQSMRALKEVGLRGIVYQESFGPDPRLAAENLGKMHQQLDDLRPLETNLIKAGVSPHAPYTVSGPQLKLISRLAIEEDTPLMMHAAESAAEQMFLTDGTGPFAEGLKQRGIEWQPPKLSTVDYLQAQGILETQPLLAHCINVNDSDLELIKNARAGIAHCPKSNAKLRHGRARFGDLIRPGIAVGLGSDSVASNNNCDLLEEARFATLTARTVSNEEVTAEDALFAATLGGARAMHLDHLVGCLREGLQADMAIVNIGSSHHQPVTNPVDTLIFSSSGRDVVLTMVAGQEVYQQGCVTMVQESEFISKIQDVRQRLESATA